MEEIKVGDKVRVSKDAPKVYQKGSVFDYTEHQSTVHELDGDAAIIVLDIEDSPIYSAPIAIPTKYLIKVEDEAKEAKFKRGDKVVSKSPFIKKVWTVLGYDDKMPRMVMVGNGRYIDERNLELCTAETEAEIIRQREAELNEFAKEELDRVHHPEKYATYEATIDNVAVDWEKYTADLAKEIAIVYAKQKRDVRMAVRVAKSVVEELKKK